MLLLPFELAGELLLPASETATTTPDDGVRSFLLANKLGGFNGALDEDVDVAEEEVVEELVMLLLSSDSNGFTGLLLFTDFSLRDAADDEESSDLAIFCKVGQGISQYVNEAGSRAAGQAEGTSIRA